jgi:hypothetical protein
VEQVADRVPLEFPGGEAIPAKVVSSMKKYCLQSGILYYAVVFKVVYYRKK